LHDPVNIKESIASSTEDIVSSPDKLQDVLHASVLCRKGFHLNLRTLILMFKPISSKNYPSSYSSLSTCHTQLLATTGIELWYISKLGD
jgi:hypothetical protein